MRYVKFGSSDMMVSEVCAGTMTWGSFNDEEQTWAQLDAAMAAGINFYDTAEMYPVPPNPDWMNRTEVFMGRWLKTRVQEGKVDRSKIYIATKIAGSGAMFGPGGMPRMRGVLAARADPCGERPPKGYDAENGPLPALTAEQMMIACKASIERLNCDYLDLYQIHWPQRYVPGFGSVEYKVQKERPEDMPTPESFDKQVLGLKALFEAGLIKHWGLSNETSFGMMSFCAACDRNGVPRPVSVQNDVSMLYRGFEEQSAEVCRHMNIAGMPYGALAGGTLTGKYEEDAAVPATEHSRHNKFPGFQPRYAAPPARAAARKYLALAKKHGLTGTQLALAWMKSRWWNTSIIIGTTSVEQLHECVAAFDIQLSQEVLDGVDAIHRECRNPNVTD